MTYLLSTLAFLAAFCVLFFLTFVFFAAVIMFRNIRDSGVLETLSPSVIVLIKLALYIGLLMDATLNIVFLTVYYFELPKEILSTFRVKRWYWSEGDSRNKRKSIWFAKNFLLPIDPHHMDR
jgi:hypothetical protein